MAVWKALICSISSLCYFPRGAYIADIISLEMRDDESAHGDLAEAHEQDREGTTVQFVAGAEPPGPFEHAEIMASTHNAVVEVTVCLGIINWIFRTGYRIKP